MNTAKIEEMAAKLHKNAKKSFEVKHNNLIYSFLFNGSTGNYDVSLNNSHYMSINSRKEKDAKAFLIHYLNN